MSAPGNPPPSDPTNQLVGPRESKFLLLSTRTPDMAEFTGPDGGKTAHYMLR